MKGQIVKNTTESVVTSSYNFARRTLPAIIECRSHGSLLNTSSPFITTTTHWQTLGHHRQSTSSHFCALAASQRACHSKASGAVSDQQTVLASSTCYAVSGGEDAPESVKSAFAARPLRGPGVPMTGEDSLCEEIGGRQRHVNSRRRRRRRGRLPASERREETLGTLHHSSVSRERVSSSHSHEKTPAPSSTLSALELALCCHIQRGEWATALDLMQRRLREATEVTKLKASEATQDEENDLFTEGPSRQILTSTDADARASLLQASAVSSAPLPSLQERCVWLLLWHGHEAAAYRVWQTLSQTLLLSPSAYTMPRAAAAPASEDQPHCSSSFALTSRVHLVFALYLRFVVQDKQRMRDVLLLHELALKAEMRAARVGAASRSTTSSSDTASGVNAETNEKQWTALFFAWLRCFEDTDAVAATATAAVSSRTDADFVHLALQRITICVTENRAKDATVAALLLLHAAERCPSNFIAVATADAAPAGSTSPTTSPDPLGNTHKVVLEEVMRHVKGQQQHRSDEQSALSKKAISTTARSSDVGQNELKSEGGAMADKRQEQLQTIFSAAAHELTQSRIRYAWRSGDASTADTSLGLAAYRFWFVQLLRTLGREHVWTALLEACGSASLRGGAAMGKARGETNKVRNATAAAEVRQVNKATDRGDWVAALHLCLNEGTPDHQQQGTALEGPASATRRASALPWVQRLRKGLTACEVAAKRTTRPTAVPWHGALALWHLAQAHRSDVCVDDLERRSTRFETHLNTSESCALRREYGRIFMLLATATRWCEALQCFHSTPTPCIDGFVVSQVGYALRASPARCDAAVLDVWAAWRCRVGDAVEPTEEMVAQLLQAMLHASSSSSKSTSVSAGDGEGAPPGAASPTAVASFVATQTLLAAAVTTNTTPPLKEAATLTDATDAESETSVQMERVTPTFAPASQPPLPGTAVPLDWQRHRLLVHRLCHDRWEGTWAEALAVAVASADVSLLRLAATRVPPSPSLSSSGGALTAVASGLPSLYARTTEHLRRRGVALSAGDRAALWSLLGPAQIARSSSDEEDARGTTHAEPQPHKRREAEVAQAAANAEKLLNELLGHETQP